jgi:hypothetical protein
LCWLLDSSVSFWQILNRNFANPCQPTNLFHSQEYPEWFLLVKCIIHKYSNTIRLHNLMINRCYSPLFDKVFNAKGIWVSSDMQRRNSYGVIHQEFPSI